MACEQKASFLEDTTNFRNICFVLTMLELFISTYSMYLLIYHSPSQMKEMKWYLINMACWTRALDLAYSFFIIPYFFIPTLVVLPLGALSIIGLIAEIQLISLVVILTGLASAVIMIFENRFNAISPPNFRFKIYKRRRYHIVMSIFSFSLLISSFLKLEDQKTAKESYAEYVTCSTAELFAAAFSYKPVSVTMLIATVLLFSLLVLIQVELKTVPSPPKKIRKTKR